MKKAMAVVVVAAVAMVAQAALAWDVPTSTKGVMDTGGKMALQTALNKKLEANKCAFKGNTANTTCDLNKVSRELAAAYKGAKEAADYHVYINIEADDTLPPAKGKEGAMSGSERANKVSDKLRGGLAAAALTESWHYNTKASGNKGNNLNIAVEVK